MTSPAVPPAAPASTPGKTLGVVGVIFAFLFPLLGLILSIIAKVQSRAAGVKNTPSTVGIVLSIIFIVGYILILVTVFGGLLAGCSQLGPGVHNVNGVTLTCS